MADAALPIRNRRRLHEDAFSRRSPLPDAGPPWIVEDNIYNTPGNRQTNTVSTR
jgi:hypothetical protein